MQSDGLKPREKGGRGFVERRLWRRPVVGRKDRLSGRPATVAAKQRPPVLITFGRAEVGSLIRCIAIQTVADGSGGTLWTCSIFPEQRRRSLHEAHHIHRGVAQRRLKFEAGEDRQQDPKGETHVGKYVASWQWQPLDSIGTIWRDLRVYLFDLFGIFRSCQGRGREFESRFPLHLHGSTRTSGASSVIAPMAAACAHP